MSFTQNQLEAALSAMMQGQTPEQVEVSMTIPAATLKKWGRKYCVKDWLEVPKLGNLLRSGLFHLTSRECLLAMLDSRQILPFTSGQFKDWKLTDPTVAEALKSVALFDFSAVTWAVAAARILLLASQANHHAPAVLLQIDHARLSQSLVPWTAQIQKEHPYRIALANVETWHPGPMAWEAVVGCWTWSKVGQLQGAGWFPKGGAEILQDFSHLLGESESLIQAMNSTLILTSRRGETR